MADDAVVAGFTGGAPEMPIPEVLLPGTADPQGAALEAGLAQAVLPAALPAAELPAAGLPAAEPLAAAPAGPAPRVTLAGEFLRVLRTRPDWVYGMLSSWLLGLGTFAFLEFIARPTGSPMSNVVVPVVLTAVADGSLTNQLAAEPGWAADLLRSGADPGRILLVRNILLAFWELCFVALVVALAAWRHHDTTWIQQDLPQLAVLPLTSIAIGNLASVLVPCPFMRLSKRFQAVGTWARWTIYMAIPFALSSVAGALWALPTLVERHFEPKVITHTTRIEKRHHFITVSLPHVSHAYLVIWLFIIPLWHLSVWLLSLKLSQGLARVRRHGIVRLLERHDDLTTQLPNISLVTAARQLPRRVREIPKDLRRELKLIGSECLEATTTLSRL